MPRKLFSAMAIAAASFASLAVAVPASGCTTLGVFSGGTPLECATAVALNVSIEVASLFASDSRRAGRFENRLRAAALERLAKSGVTSDPAGRKFYLEVHAEFDGGFKIILSPPGERPPCREADPDWEISRTVRFDDEDASKSPEQVEQQIEDAALSALSQALGSSDSCHPARVSSSDGGFVLELAPANPRVRSRYLRERLNLDPSEEIDLAPRGSLFERSPKGAEELRSTFRLDRERYPGEFRVAESGAFVAAHRTGGCVLEGFAVTIYRPDGTVVRTFSLDDLLTPGDIESVHRLGLPAFEVSIDDLTDRLVITLDEKESSRKIEVDLKTGLALVPPRNLFPQFRVDSEVYGPNGGFDSKGWREPLCVGERLDFGAMDLVPETSPRFVGRARVSPLPEYTEIAKRARLQGTVDVEAVVSETGRVLCARVTNFPMGLPDKVEAVMLGWRFQPAIVEGKPVRTIGRIAIQFHVVDPLNER